MRSLSGFSLVLPFFIWVILLLGVGPEFLEQRWECLLVIFAALELVPRGLRLLTVSIHPTYWIGVIGLCVAYIWASCWFLALPYILWATWLALREATEMLVQKKIQRIDYVRVAALVYWATGAIFAGMFLVGISPLGFDLVIVSLTAAHFHVAGFVLAVVVYSQYRLLDNGLSRNLALATMVGMPLVAAGITATQMGLSHLYEQMATLAFVGFAVGVLWQQIRLIGLRKFGFVARMYWFLGVLSLVLGLFLAALYAIRFQFPTQWVNIPNMKIWHGTLNTIGFAWMSLLGFDSKNNFR